MFDKFPLARYGVNLYAAFAVLFGASTLVGSWWLTAPLLALFAFTLFFFRDPARRHNSAPNQVISPADGTVVHVGQAEHADMPGGQAMLVSIFMSLFNVHVNRAPIDGEIVSSRHVDGGYAMANLDQARHANERQEVLIDIGDGKRLLVTQVAGMVARRIECELSPGQIVQKGVRYGMIRFGSRLDVYLPLDARPTVQRGQKVRAGITVIGEL